MEGLDKHVLHGTSTVGIKCKDGIVLAADKRATAGNFIADRNAQKIVEIADEMAVTTAGGVSDNQLLTKLIRAEIKLKDVRSGRKITVKETGNLLASLVFSNIRKMSMIPGITHLLLGGKDSTGYYLYDIYPDGSLSEVDKFVSSGSGSVMAYGVLETLYEDGMDMDAAVKLAIKCLNAALRRDSASGDGYAVLTITSEGMKRIIDKNMLINL